MCMNKYYGGVYNSGSFLFLSRCLKSYVVFIHVIIYYVMFLANKRIFNLESNWL